MAPRAYSMKQNSFWREEEWTFLEQAVLDVEVQEFIAKGQYNKARAVLAGLFRAKFTGPTGGEKDAVFKKRLRWTKKDRKAIVERRRAETQGEWEARMNELNDRLVGWLTGWRTRARRAGTKPWQPPVIGKPKTRKPAKQTGYDVYCKSDEAPQGSEYMTADGRRCDLQGLNAARAAAWKLLSPEEQASYVAAAQDTFDDAGTPCPAPSEQQPADSKDGTAEDIVAYVDEFAHVMQNDVGWGGFVVFGGPDHTGDACIHSQTVGTNRRGQTFLDALLQVIGWTQVDFDTVFSLWVEQCRQGPQEPEDRTFAEAARHAIEHSRTQVASIGSAPSNLGTAATRAPNGTPFTGGGAQATPDAAAVLEALTRLTLAIQPRNTAIEVFPEAALCAQPRLDASTSSGGPSPSIPAVLPSAIVPAHPAHDALAMRAAPTVVGAPHVLESGTLYMQIDRQVLDNQASHLNAASMIGYEPGCALLSDPLNMEAAMDWQQDIQPAYESVEDHFQALPLDFGGDALLPGDSAGDVSRSRLGKKPSGGSRRRKESEPSGVPMPGIRGLQVIERVLRPRNPRNREDTADGSIPLTMRPRAQPPSMNDYIVMYAWRNVGELPEIKGYWKSYNSERGTDVVNVFRHKGIMAPRGFGIENRLYAFPPEVGQWIPLNSDDPSMNGRLSVRPDAKYALFRFDDVPFLPGFGDALTKASIVLERDLESWPPEEEARNIIIHGIGTRLVRIVFWAREASLPTEFVVRMDEGDNIEPVLYDALAQRLDYTGEIDFWNVGQTDWFRLPKEACWELSRKYTTFCVRASEGVAFTPGLGWEVSQLERQHGGGTRDVGTSIEGLLPSDGQAD